MQKIKFKMLLIEKFNNKLAIYKKVLQNLEGVLSHLRGAAIQIWQKLDL